MAPDMRQAGQSRSAAPAGIGVPQRVQFPELEEFIGRGSGNLDRVVEGSLDVYVKEWRPPVTDKSLFFSQNIHKVAHFVIDV